jgi:hypothetical protein
MAAKQAGASSMQSFSSQVMPAPAFHRPPLRDFLRDLSRALLRILPMAGLLTGLLLCASARAQADAGLLTEIRGAATYQAAGSAELATQTLMKLRVGDRLRLPAAASLKLVYFKSATAETWRGPASFVVGEEHSEQTNGEFTSTVLPGAARAPVELSRLSNLNRIGAVVVRGIKPPESDLSQARTLHAAWRGETPSDDILPDLYLYSVLKQYNRKADMQALAAEMLKRAPDSEAAKRLARESAAK